MSSPVPRRRRPRLTERQVFTIVALADVAACQALTSLHLSEVIWLLNLPATITVGRMVSDVAGDAAALAVTVSGGAALYGWAAGRLHSGYLVTGLEPARDN